MSFICTSSAFAQVDPAQHGPDSNIAAQTRPDEQVSGPVAPVDLPTTTAPSEQVASPGDLVVRKVAVEGADRLDEIALRNALAPFQNRLLSRDDLQRLLSAVSGVARADGYLFARSTIPAQELSKGVLLIQLDLGRIDEVRLLGTQSAAVHDLLMPLVGHAPRKAELERQLMLAADLPGISVGSSRYSLENGRGVLLVPIQHKAIAARAAIDNRGLSALGPVRLQLGVDVNGLLAGDDQLSIDGVVTPLQPKELGAVFSRYSKQINSQGTTVSISASYARTHLGEPFAAYNAKGNSVVLSAGVSHPLMRSRASSIWVGATLKEALINQFWDGERVLRDRITTAGVNVNGNWLMGRGRLRAGASLTQGLSAFGATVPGDPLASRPGAGSKFTKLAFSSSWQGDILGPISARLALEAQWASAPLPSSEQMSIGGPAFGRAYEFGELSGDMGILASAELRGDVFKADDSPLNLVQLYGFVDMGDVSNKSWAFGTGTRYSAGPGARLTLFRDVDLQLEAAFPLGDVRGQSGDKSPRMSVTVKVRQ